MVDTQKVKSSKTLGHRTSRLVTTLYDEGRTVFDLPTAAEAMGVSHSRAASLIHAATKRGLITHVRRGVYNLVPFELGSTTYHLDGRYLLVREVMGNTPYFLSHASALDIHQLATQPILDVYVTSTRRRKNSNLGGSFVHFVWAPPKRFFGYELIRVGKVEIFVSDIERTLLDGVSLPENCGGFIEVAKAYFIAKDKVNIQKMLIYMHKFEKISVIRRAGFLLDVLGLAEKRLLDNLAKTLPAGYVKLDPTMPDIGQTSSKWGLKLNVSVGQIENAVSN